MKILILGPQASGKGTQGDKLGELLHIPHISVGQILRDTPKDFPNYAQIMEQLNKGVLVNSDISAGILKNALESPEYKDGYILEGWGRRMLDLRTYDPGFDLVILINISKETTFERVSGRRTCSRCGEVFNIHFIKPKVDGICDTCGGELIQRDDDKPEALAKRLEIYNTDTQEVIKYFTDKNILLSVDGEGTPEEVFSNIVKSLKIQ